MAYVKSGSGYSTPETIHPGDPVTIGFTLKGDWWDWACGIDPICFADLDQILCLAGGDEIRIYQGYSENGPWSELSSYSIWHHTPCATMEHGVIYPSNVHPGTPLSWDSQGNFYLAVAFGDENPRDLPSSNYCVIPIHVTIIPPPNFCNISIQVNGIPENSTATVTVKGTGPSGTISHTDTVSYNSPETNAWPFRQGSTVTISVSGSSIIGITGLQEPVSTTKTDDIIPVYVTPCDIVCQIGQWIPWIVLGTGACVAGYIIYREYQRRQPQRVRYG